MKALDLTKTPLTGERFCGKSNLWHFTGGILYAPKGECRVHWTDFMLVSQNIDIKAGKNRCGFLRGAFHFDFQPCVWGFDEPEMQSET